MAEQQQEKQGKDLNALGRVLWHRRSVILLSFALTAAAARYSGAACDGRRRRNHIRASTKPTHSLA